MLENCSPHMCGFSGISWLISCAMPLAAWCLQLLLYAVFGAPIIPTGSCVCNKHGFSICLRFVGPAWGEGDVGDTQGLTTPIPVPALAAPTPAKKRKRPLGKGLNLQIPASSCCQRFTGTPLLYNTHLP